MAGARMQDIADEAGINKALLHYYFRSKEKLFEMIFKEVVTRIFTENQLTYLNRIKAFLKRLKCFAGNILTK